MQTGMTTFERLLKERFLLRFGDEHPILTSDELNKYIRWMIESYTGAEDPLPDEPELGGIAARINQSERTAFPELFGNAPEHRELRFLRTTHDISVGHMFRYMPAHWHTNEFFELYYCRDGICPVHFERETVELKRGDVLIIAPQVLHASPCYKDDAVLFYYMIRSSTFQEVFWNQLPPDSLMAQFFRLSLNRRQHAAYLHFATGEDPQIEHLLEQINVEFQSPEAYGGKLMNALMSTFFVLLLRRYEGTARLPRTSTFSWKHEFSAIFSYIQQHYADRTLQQVAEEFHYSERQLSRIVEKLTGETYAHLTRRLKMERAAALLRRPDMKLEAVSEICGYSNVPSFIRAFESYYGTTPARRRRNQTE